MYLPKLARAIAHSTVLKARRINFFYLYYNDPDHLVDNFPFVNFFPEEFWCNFRPRLSTFRKNQLNFFTDQRWSGTHRRGEVRRSLHFPCSCSWCFIPVETWKSAESAAENRRHVFAVALSLAILPRLFSLQSDWKRLSWLVHSVRFLP